MILKLVSAAVLAVLAGWGVASAQSAGDFGGPREQPPASFSGQQYVDSKGCVFLRAGFGGQVTWVPRVNANRSQLCGYPPTFGNNQVAVAEPAAPAKPRVEAPRPARVAPAPVARRPMNTVASLTTPPRIRAVTPSQGKPDSGIARQTYAPPPVAATGVAPVPRAVGQKPVAAPVPRPQPAERVATQASGSKIGCYRDAPVAERFRLHGGGTVVLCTRGDGDIGSARPPRVLAGPAAVAPSGYLQARDPAAAVKMHPTPQVAVSSQNQPAIPKGYKAAFTDDRLNPNRGKGTQQGWADQDQVWTREVPSRLVADAARAKGKTVKGKTVVVRRVIVSSKSQAPSASPAEAAGKTAAAAHRYVQVGTFGQPGNAEGASSRLSRLGLPVARSNITKGGRPLQIVLAGPFASAGAAQAALAAARRAGFGDAFIR